MAKKQVLIKLEVASKSQEARSLCAAILWPGKTAFVTTFTKEQLGMVVRLHEQGEIAILDEVPAHLLQLIGFEGELRKAEEAPVVEETPAVETTVETPATETTVETPAVETTENTPAAETTVETPAADPAVEPAKEITAEDIDAMTKEEAYTYATEVLALEIGKRTSEPKIKNRIKAQVGFEIVEEEADEN